MTFRNPHGNVSLNIDRNSLTIPSNLSYGMTQKKTRSNMHEDDILYVILNGRKIGRIYITQG